MELKDKTVIIAGGADGIGLDIATKYIKAGAKSAIIVDIDKERGEEAKHYINTNYGENKAEFIHCDISKDLDKVYNEIVQKHRTVDVLVNCVILFNEDNPKLMVDVSLTALLEWSLKFYNHMSKDNNGQGGTIVNISSIFGFRPIHKFPIYHAIKFGIVGFSRSLGHRRNFDTSGVRVIAICPGYTKTKLTEAFYKEGRSLPADIREELKNNDFQSVDVVGNAAVDIFERARSGTMWLVEGGRPAEEIK